MSVQEQADKLFAGLGGTLTDCMIAQWRDGCRWAVEGYTVQQHIDVVGSDQGTLVEVECASGGKLRVRRIKKNKTDFGAAGFTIRCFEYGPALGVRGGYARRGVSVTTNRMSDSHKRITEQWMVARAMQYATGTYSKEEFSKDKANFMKEIAAEQKQQGEAAGEASKEREEKREEERGEPLKEAARGGSGEPQRESGYPACKDPVTPAKRKFGTSEVTDKQTTMKLNETQRKVYATRRKRKLIATQTQ